MNIHRELMRKQVTSTQCYWKILPNRPDAEEKSAVLNATRVPLNGQHRKDNSL